MDSALSSPLLKAALFPEAFNEEAQRSANSFWRSSLDRLAQGKGNWEQFLEKAPLTSHPALYLTTTRTKETLLHLAVLSNREDLVEILATDPHLKFKRNAQGLNPLELALFLHQKPIIALLSPDLKPSFSKQPSVSFNQVEIPSELEYLPHPIFESPKLFEEILARTQKAKGKDAIPPERIWMGIYFDKEILKGIHPPVSIQRVDEEVGYGVFAKQRIAPCAFVGEYTGVVREWKKTENEFYVVRYTTWETEKKKFHLDFTWKGNFTRFINHSAEPNLSLQTVYWRGIPRMIFVALQEIAEGAQLTFDYGPLFWKECRQTPKVL